MTAVEGHPATMADARRFFRAVTVAHELLDEVHARPLDDAAHERLAQLFDWILATAEDALPEPLRRELEALAAGVDVHSATEGEVRVDLAELVGWLDGTVASTPFMVPADAEPVSSP